MCVCMRVHAWTRSVYALGTGDRVEATSALFGNLLVLQVAKREGCGRI